MASMFTDFLAPVSSLKCSPAIRKQRSNDNNKRPLHKRSLGKEESGKSRAMHRELWIRPAFALLGHKAVIPERLSEIGRSLLITAVLDLQMTLCFILFLWCISPCHCHLKSTLPELALPLGTIRHRLLGTMKGLQIIWAFFFNFNFSLRENKRYL